MNLKDHIKRILQYHINDTQAVFYIGNTTISFERKQLLLNKKHELNEKVKQLLKENDDLRIKLQMSLETSEKWESQCKEFEGSLTEQHDRLDKIYDKLYRLDWEPNQNIRQRLFHLAGMETADFVIKNMNDVPALNVTLNILDLALSKVTVDGMYLEFGVFSGRTINHIAECILDKTVYGFDSFKGLPENWRSGFEKGTFKCTSLPDVKSNVLLIQGLFSDTLPLFTKDHSEKCAFIHIDCDLYSSTKCIFDNLKGYIVSGTVISFDEFFNYPGWKEGEYKAFMEFIKETGLQYEYLGYVEISEQVAVKII